MLLKQLRKQNEKGFTIIEVLIVLAIAALILLIVFLAVPALQRTARNTSRHEDADNVLAALNEYYGNNGATYPLGVTVSTAPYIATFCNVTAYTCASQSAAESTSKLGYYNAANATPATQTITIYGTQTGMTAFTTTPATAADEMLIAENAVCSTANAASTTNAGPRNVAILYGIEAGGAYTWECVQGS